MIPVRDSFHRTTLDEKGKNMLLTRFCSCLTCRCENKWNKTQPFIIGYTSLVFTVGALAMLLYVVIWPDVRMRVKLRTWNWHFLRAQRDFGVSVCIRACGWPSCRHPPKKKDSLPHTHPLKCHPQWGHVFYVWNVAAGWRGVRQQPC